MSLSVQMKFLLREITKKIHYSMSRQSSQTLVNILIFDIFSIKDVKYKSCYITPVYNYCDECNSGNYIAISLISFLTKLQEKVLHPNKPKILKQGTFFNKH